MRICDKTTTRGGAEESRLCREPLPSECSGEDEGKTYKLTTSGWFMRNKISFSLATCVSCLMEATCRFCILFRARGRRSASFQRHCEHKPAASLELVLGADCRNKALGALPSLLSAAELALERSFAAKTLPRVPVPARRRRI